jgi:hypothetical protein
MLLVKSLLFSVSFLRVLLQNLRWCSCDALCYPCLFFRVKILHILSKSLSFSILVTSTLYFSVFKFDLLARRGLPIVVA